MNIFHGNYKQEEEETSTRTEQKGKRVNMIEFQLFHFLESIHSFVRSRRACLGFWPQGENQVLPGCKDEEVEEDEEDDEDEEDEDEGEDADCRERCCCC